MLSIKKIGGLVILTAIFLPSAFSQPLKSSYGFTLSPDIGILYGQSEEIVYHYPKDDLYLSELLWDMKPLLYAGFGANFGPLDHSRKLGFAAALSFKASLPARSGIIENRDWFNPDVHYVTHYSRHDAYSGTAILLDISAGNFWRFSDSLALTAYGEFSYMHFLWTAKDGYTQHTQATSGIYPPWNNSLPKDYFSGDAIKYRQDWLIFSPGVSLDWDMGRLFSMKAHINYSPLIYCAARDDHLPGLSGHTTYFDYISFGHYFKGGGALTLSPSANTDISLFASYKRITSARGDTYVRGVKTAEDGAGAGHSAMDLGLAVNLRLSKGTRD